jgi:hypothetical protein
LTIYSGLVHGVRLQQGSALQRQQRQQQQQQLG